MAFRLVCALLFSQLLLAVAASEAPIEGVCATKEWYFRLCFSRVAASGHAPESQGELSRFRHLIEACNEDCDHYKHLQIDPTCIGGCTGSFAQCEYRCRDRFSWREQIRGVTTQHYRIAVAKRQYEIDPYSHPGTSFTELDCDKVRRRKVFLKFTRNIKYAQIQNYFRSRCDFEFTEDEYYDKVYFVWYEFPKQVSWDLFRPKKQIVNHINSVRKLLDYKNQMYR